VTEDLDGLAIRSRQDSPQCAFPGLDVGAVAVGVLVEVPQEPARKAIPFSHLAGFVQRPTEIVEPKVSLRCVSGHRCRVPVRWLVGSASGDGFEVVDRREEVVVGLMRF